MWAGELKELGIHYRLSCLMFRSMSKLLIAKKDSKTFGLFSTIDVIVDKTLVTLEVRFSMICYNFEFLYG